jgi:hypothetical protein
VEDSPVPVPSRRLARIRATYEPDVERLFRKATAAIRERTDLKVLTKALRENEHSQSMAAHAALQVVPLSVGEKYLDAALPVLTMRIVADSGNAAVKDLATYLTRKRPVRKALGAEDLPHKDIGIKFDVTNPESMAWIRAHSGELIREWGASNMAALRVMVEQAFAEGIPPRELAVIIRQSGIGLTERLARAVMRRKAMLRSLAPDMAPDVLAGKVARYAAKLERYRARMIARTETLAASNRGQDELWGQAMDRKLLDGTEEVTWLASGLGNVCDTCASMDGQTIPLSQYRQGAAFPGGNLPPVHPHCECCLGLQ